MTIAELLKTLPGRDVIEDPKYVQGYRDGRSGKPKEDSSEPYQIGYRQGRELAAARGGLDRSGGTDSIK